MAGLPLFGIAALQAHEAEHAGAQLIERAGEAAAQWLLERDPSCMEILVVAGPGNNGGDAYATARHLSAAGKRLTVVAVALPKETSLEAQRAYDLLVACGVRVVREMPQAAFRPDWIIDGVFGIGLNREPEQSFRAAIDGINLIRQNHAAQTKVLSLDVPSGVDAQTGYTFSPCVIADYTLSFLARKPGMYTGEALNYTGEIHVLDLNVSPPSAATDGVLVRWEDVKSALPWRHRTAHKGTCGTLMVVGGGAGMLGAPILAARAALRAGAGKVHVGFMATNAPQVDMRQPELMLETFSKFRENLDAIVIGPGIGLATASSDALGQALRLDVPLVLDADALTLISQNTALADRVRARTSPTILTPHPGEAARLLHTAVDYVNGDRIASARSISEQFRVNVVLKGAGSVCVSDRAAMSINTTGNPLLATAGTGDVLAGMIGSLLAQNMQPFHALVLAVAWHGHLADQFALKGRPRIVAGDIVDALASGE